jgi:23S rRNA (guanosine2251-2'-O)-methyltransferase
LWQGSEPEHRNQALQENNIWIWVVETGGTPYYESNYDCGCAFVLGGEDVGVTRLVKENSDFVASIPMYGKINSLNVSNAAAIVLLKRQNRER